MEIIWPSLLVIAVYLSLVIVQRSLERVEHKVNMILRHLNIDVMQGVPLSDRVKEIARDPARKIEAIKVYREETGASLVDAKKAVEDYMHSL